MNAATLYGIRSDRLRDRAAAALADAEGELDEYDLDRMRNKVRLVNSRHARICQLLEKAVSVYSSDQAREDALSLVSANLTQLERMVAEIEVLGPQRPLLLPTRRVR